MERSAEGQLLYGVRKSYMLKTTDAASTYKATVDILRNSGRDVSRMDAIYKVCAPS